MALRRLAASSLRQVLLQHAEAAAAAEASLGRRSFLSTIGKDVLSKSAGTNAQLSAALRAAVAQQQQCWGSWQGSQQPHRGLHLWPSLHQAAQPAVADEDSEPDLKEGSSKQAHSL